MLHVLQRYCLVIFGLVLLVPVSLAADPKAYWVQIDESINPASQDLINRTLEEANQQKSPLFILQLNTPGGLDFSMRKIIAAILDSETPVVTYVSPAGSRAASAGTYILFASHVAAMAPTTHLGAATPVQIGGIPELPDLSGKEEGESAEQASAMEKKLINDAIAYIRGLAELHGRNSNWAELAVREGLTLTSQQALDKNVIDLIAVDIDDLLNQIDGRVIKVGGIQTTLKTKDLQIEKIEADWRHELLSIISDPNIAYILMLVGIYGLIFEFSSPGYVLPGVAGAICLILALYAFQVLPVSYAGLGLVSVGLLFLIAEAFVSSGGVLGVGGLISFVIGSIILFDDEHLAVSIPLIGGIALIAGGFLFWIVSRIVKLRHKKIVSGAESMSGQIGQVIADFSSDHSSFDGRVRLNGESWLAHSSEPVLKGQKVRVVTVDDLTLEVEVLETLELKTVKES